MNTINITTSGPDTVGKELVTNIISRALVEQGFSNVALVNVVGEPMVGSDVPSIMSQIKAANPTFFETPIRIWTQETKDPETELDESLKLVRGVEEMNALTDNLKGGVAKVEETVAA